MRGNGHLGASGQKYGSVIRSGDLDFHIRQVYFHYRMTFAAYIWCFCAQLSFDLVTLTLDPLTSAVYDELSFIHPTHLPIFSFPWLSVPELWTTQSDHITITRNGHYACAESRDLSPRGKNDAHFWNPWPQFVYALCHFQGATTKIKPCEK